MKEASDFDDFYVDRKNDRAIHVGWEDETTIYIDVFDTAAAAWNSEKGKCLAAVLIDVATGEVTTEEARI